MTVQLRQLHFRYPTERFTLRVADWSAAEKESIAIVGSSGCGKTTLLRIIAGILRPQQGQTQVLGTELRDLGERKVRAFRIQNIGLIFQEFELLDYLSAKDNILLPFRLTSALRFSPEVSKKLESLADATGISELLDAFPRQLSQGERQRVAICRALITAPRLLLADEPTGSLDPENQQRIVDLLTEQAREHQATLIMVTHDHQLLGQFDRVVPLQQLQGEA